MLGAGLDRLGIQIEVQDGVEVGVSWEGSFRLHEVKERFVLKAVLALAESHFIGEADPLRPAHCLHSLKVGLEQGLGFLLGGLRKEPAAHERACINHGIVRVMALRQA